MRINNFSISLMRRDGMSIAEIADKTGLEPDEITRRLRAYTGTIMASAKMSAMRAKKGSHHKDKHPEQG